MATEHASLGLQDINSTGFVENTTSSGSLTGQVVVSISPSSPVAQIVRKCVGKPKNPDCIQNQEHSNTRWECAFASNSREEFNKHCKNIAKRTKWRELIEKLGEGDKNGVFHCVYFSTDRHHVENHYHKGGDGRVSPNVQTGRYKSSGFRQDEGRELKRMKQDASLVSYFHEQVDPNTDSKEGHLPDTTKTADLLENIQNKLQLSPEICREALEKLHKQGFFIILGMKNLRKDGWERLALPTAVEEELRREVVPQRNVSPWYHMGVPFAWGFPPQGAPQLWQYNNVSQPIYVPTYQQYESQDSVLEQGEVSEKEKEKTEEKGPDPEDVIDAVPLDASSHQLESLPLASLPTSDEQLKHGDSQMHDQSSESHLHSQEMQTENSQDSKQ